MLAPPLTRNTGEESYVSPIRLQELRAIQHRQFDLTKLIRLLEEINKAKETDNLISIALLVRATLDHVPPIFGKRTFSEVANNVGPKSFKELMQHLEKSSRKVADAHLHNPVRKSETLPTWNQVDSSRDLDVLLAEIVRRLKAPA